MSSSPSLATEDSVTSKRSSIGLQMVCNADCVISNVVAKCLAQSMTPESFGPLKSISAYHKVNSLVCCWETGGMAASPFLLTPFTGPPGSTAGLQPCPCQDQGQS
ncbi:hypothetical protein J4Q44_G00091530 [Coregonus suidteri]|uniref:Uncharacterized protein n=1 Tax=Coregonus suidteri TaxID=861788 RepID=A0AAN8R0W6_9TELE